MTSTERWRKWKATDPDAAEKLRLKRQLWRKNNPEKCRAKRKRWGEKNRDHVSRYLKQWHLLKPWKKAQYALKWLAGNPEAPLHAVMIELDAVESQRRDFRFMTDPTPSPFEELCRKEDIELHQDS